MFVYWCNSKFLIKDCVYRSTENLGKETEGETVSYQNLSEHLDVSSVTLYIQIIREGKLILSKYSLSASHFYIKCLTETP